MINLLNIILIITSCVLAYIFPFELVLFSYAFLGPAHYLTEISWLHDRNYFTSSKYDYLLLSILTLSIVIVGFLIRTEEGKDLIHSTFILILVCSASMALFSSKINKVISIVVATVFFLLFFSVELKSILFIFVPTLIHVYIFTGIFILFGAIKSKSLLGKLSFLVFLFCGSVFFIFPPQEFIIINSDFINKSNFFSGLVADTAELFNFSVSKSATLSLMGFVSFAYTYHYLNWFSKTKVIQWHKISANRLIIIVFVYLFSISLYLYNYEVGFILLLYLSLLHVVLELPLNFKTIASLLNFRSK